MSSARRLHHTYDDYLALQDRSELRLEFYDGDIFAMAGGTLAHAQLGIAVGAVLRQALPASCKVFASVAKVRVEATGLTTYPDVSAVCGPLIESRLDANAIANPTLLVEVTSPSTGDYDRGEKLSHFKQLASLRVVLFVSHEAPRITAISRGRDGWVEQEFRAGERVVLAEPSVSFSVDEVYANVDLTAPTKP